MAKVCPLVDVQFFQMFTIRFGVFPGQTRSTEASATNSAIFTRLSAATISAAFSPIMIDAVRVSAHHIRLMTPHLQRVICLHPSPVVGDRPHFRFGTYSPSDRRLTRNAMRDLREARRLVRLPHRRASLRAAAAPAAGQSGDLRASVTRHPAPGAELRYDLQIMIVAEVIHADCRLNGFRERSPLRYAAHRIRQYDDRFGIRCKAHQSRRRNTVRYPHSDSYATGRDCIHRE